MLKSSLVLVGLPLSSGLAVQMVGHSPPIDLSHGPPLKDPPEQKREGQHMGQRSSSEKDSKVALGHLAMTFFFPDNPSSSQQKEAKGTAKTSGNQKLYLMSWAMTQVPSYK